ncbi:MAG: serine--tRNA ligase, partial [Candidatus Spechtbacterales bacterium]
RGADESENVVVRTVGEKPVFSFTPKDSTELGAIHNLIDTERAAKVSGTRFGYIKNEAVILEFALVRMAMDEAALEGFSPIVPPVLVGEEAMRGLGYLDKEPDQIYHIEEDDLYLVATAEHSIVPMLSGETISAEEAPQRFVGFSSAFRREAGSYGKDTRGILRVHQFDKVEMVTFATPESSNTEHELMLAIQERLMQKLEIPYQVVRICTGDMGFVAANQYDIEAWVPSENTYRETHSTSNTTDFQSRRLGIRVKGAEGTELAHIVNGTAFAIGRTLIALLENHQQEDGSIHIPQALQSYTGFDRIG